MSSNGLTVIYAAGIQGGGGIQYLKYIINEYKNKNYLIFLDSRINGKEFKRKNYVQYKNNFLLRINIFFKRILWRKKYKSDLDELFLTGIPPLFKINDSVKVKIIFQNVHHISSSYNNYLKNIHKIKFFLYRKYIKIFLDVSYEIILQTNSMMNQFRKFSRKPNKLIVNKHIHNNYFKNVYSNKYDLKKLRKEITTFNEIENIINSNKILYFYPASYVKHKNHLRLIKAFEILPENVKKNIFILLTINRNEIKKLTKEKNIITLGEINRNFINYLYKNSNFLIFPSVVESLGIPILEAKYSNLKIISSNLDVISEISNPLITFNPESIDNISSAILASYKLAYFKT